jgi:hypothetical protein
MHYMQSLQCCMCPHLWCSYACSRLVPEGSEGGAHLQPGRQRRKQPVSRAWQPQNTLDRPIGLKTLLPGMQWAAAKPLWWITGPSVRCWVPAALSEAHQVPRAAPAHCCSRAAMRSSASAPDTSSSEAPAVPRSSAAAHLVAHCSSAATMHTSTSSLEAPLHTAAVLLQCTQAQAAWRPCFSLQQCHHAPCRTHSHKN